MRGLRSRYFGVAALSSLVGLTWMAFGLAGAIGPIVMGRAYDTAQSYELVLNGAAAATLAIGWLMLTSRLTIETPGES